MKNFSIFTPKHSIVPIINLRTNYMCIFNEFYALKEKEQNIELKSAMNNLLIYVEKNLNNSIPKIYEGLYYSRSFEKKLNFYAQFLSNASDLVENPKKIEEFKKKYLNKLRHYSEIVMGACIVFISALIASIAIGVLAGMVISIGGLIGVPIATLGLGIGITGIGIGSTLIVHGIFNLKKEKSKIIQRFTCCIN